MTPNDAWLKLNKKEKFNRIRVEIPHHEKEIIPLFVWIALVLIGVMICIASCDVTPAPAQEIGYSVEQIADAIYLAEGGAKTNHPYGILTKYKHTTPRQACINTIKSAIRRYEKTNKRLDFITFLGRTYCPINCDNDNGTNKYWVKNVKYFLVKNT